MVQVSSTGSLGYEVRNDERAYLNYPEAVSDRNVDQFDRDLRNHLFTASHPEGVTRFVARAVIDGEALHHLVDESDKLRLHVEAAASVTPNDGERDEFIAYFGRNIGDRYVNRITREVLRANVRTATRVVEVRPPSVVTDSVLSDELSKLSTVDSVKDPEQLEKLWGETFGWTREGCEDFAAIVDEEVKLDPADRKVWFKGIESGEDGELVACAMAERLDMPSNVGKLALIEHTEWSAVEELRGYGLGKRVVRALTTQLKEDLEEQRKLIFAECNITSGSYIVALRSDFTIPEVDLGKSKVGQVLYNNVRVGDGYEPHGGYRSFMFAVAQ